MRGRDEASGREAGAGLHDKAGDGHGQAESRSLRGLWQGPVPARRRVGARGPGDDARRGADPVAEAPAGTAGIAPGVVRGHHRPRQALLRDGHRHHLGRGRFKRRTPPKPTPERIMVSTLGSTLHPIQEF